MIAVQSEEEERSGAVKAGGQGAWGGGKDNECGKVGGGERETTPSGWVEREAKVKEEQAGDRRTKEIRGWRGRG